MQLCHVADGLPAKLWTRLCSSCCTSNSPGATTIVAGVSTAETKLPLCSLPCCTHPLICYDTLYTYTGLTAGPSAPGKLHRAQTAPLHSLLGNRPAPNHPACCKCCNCTSSNCTQHLLSRPAPTTHPPSRQLRRQAQPLGIKNRPHTSSCLLQQRLTPAALACCSSRPVHRSRS
jgi:hypothetical protein